MVKHGMLENIVSGRKNVSSSLNDSLPFEKAFALSCLSTAKGVQFGAHDDIRYLMLGEIYTNTTGNPLRYARNGAVTMELVAQEVPGIEINGTVREDALPGILKGYFRKINNIPEDKKTLEEMYRYAFEKIMASSSYGNNASGTSHNTSGRKTVLIGGNSNG